MAALTRLLKLSSSLSLLRRSLSVSASSSPPETRRNSSTYAADPKSRNVQWVFLGIPGVGKGTYASRLSTLLGVPHNATGDLVRDSLQSSGPLSSQELGENAWWFDRFLSQHMAVFYYFMTVFMYMLSPRMAYHFSECVESHAFETYDKFIKAQGDELKKLPPSKVAVKYYTASDMYLFGSRSSASLHYSLLK